MNLLRHTDELAGIKGPLCLAIGVFDGVHPGHRAVIRHALAEARAVGGEAAVVTFDPHPQRVLRPQTAPRLLTSTRHKIELLGEIGVRHLLLLAFTSEFSRTAPEMFIRDLARPGLHSITVGHEWSFGKDRAGNLGLLRRFGEELGFQVTGIPPVQVRGKTVSSTLIREAVAAGDLAAAKRLLDRPFSLMGTVEHGAHVGRELGFPTANLGTHSEQFPPDGVYAATAWHGSQTLPGVVNIGCRPTFEREHPERILELHLIDFHGDLYGETIEVVFHKRLREERKFPGVSDLKKQIARDVAAARRTLTKIGALPWQPGH